MIASARTSESRTLRRISGAARRCRRSGARRGRAHGLQEAMARAPPRARATAARRSEAAPHRHPCLAGTTRDDVARRGVGAAPSRRGSPHQRRRRSPCARPHRGEEHDLAEAHLILARRHAATSRRIVGWARGGCKGAGGGAAGCPGARGCARERSLCGSNSVGRVPASQAGCRGFDPRLPLCSRWCWWGATAKAAEAVGFSRPFCSQREQNRRASHSRGAAPRRACIRPRAVRAAPVVGRRPAVRAAGLAAQQCVQHAATRACGSSRREASGGVVDARLRAHGSSVIRRSAAASTSSRENGIGW